MEWGVNNMVSEGPILVEDDFATLLAELAACEKRLTASIEGALARCSAQCPNAFGGFTATATPVPAPANDEAVFDAWPIFDEESIFDGEPLFDEEPNDRIIEYVDVFSSGYDVSFHGNRSVQSLQLERLCLAGRTPDPGRGQAGPALVKRDTILHARAAAGGAVLRRATARHAQPRGRAYPHRLDAVELPHHRHHRLRHQPRLLQIQVSPRRAPRHHLATTLSWNRLSIAIPKGSLPNFSTLELADEVCRLVQCMVYTEHAAVIPYDDLNGQLCQRHDNVCAAHEVFEVFPFSAPAAWVNIGRILPTRCWKIPWPPPILLESLCAGIGKLLLLSATSQQDHSHDSMVPAINSEEPRLEEALESRSRHLGEPISIWMAWPQGGSSMEFSKGDRTASLDRPSTENVRQLSLTDRVVSLSSYRRARVLCDCCMEKWSYGHQCAITIQLHAIEEVWKLLSTEGAQEHIPETTEQLLMAVSVAAWSGSDGAATLRLQDQIQQLELMVLIDSGSSHSFLSDRLRPQWLGVQTLRQSLLVKVANSDEIDKKTAHSLYLAAKEKRFRSQNQPWILLLVRWHGMTRPSLVLPWSCLNIWELREWSLLWNKLTWLVIHGRIHGADPVYIQGRRANASLVLMYLAQVCVRSVLLIVNQGNFSTFLWDPGGHAKRSLGTSCVSRSGECQIY
jgi:hypothetical protein